MDPWTFSLQARATGMGWGQLPATPSLRDAHVDPAERMAGVCRELFQDREELVDIQSASLAGRVAADEVEMDPWSSLSPSLTIEEPESVGLGNELGEDPTTSPSSASLDQRALGQILPRIRWAEPEVDEAFWIAFAKIHAEDERPAKPCFWESVTLQMEQSLSQQWRQRLRGVLRRRLVCTHFNNMRRFRTAEAMDERLADVQRALGLPRKKLWVDRDLFLASGPRGTQHLEELMDAAGQAFRQGRPTTRAASSRRSPSSR